MADNFINKKKNGKVLVLEFPVSIDEQLQFIDIGRETFEELVIDANRVDTINSRGVREWVRWIQSIPSTAQVTITKCPQVIIDQINSISGFLPEKAKVESFYVPYYCNACDLAANAMFYSKTDLGNHNLKDAKTTCEKCGGPVEWEVVESSYFRFLSDKNKKA